MNFLEFRDNFIDVGCVGTHQIRALYPDFNTNNLTRWVKQGLLVKLRRVLLVSFVEKKMNEQNS